MRASRIGSDLAALLQVHLDGLKTGTKPFEGVVAKIEYAQEI